MVSLERSLEVLTKNCMNSEKWWIWIGAQNAFGLFATWASVMAALNLAVILQYAVGVARLPSGATALALLLFFFVLWSLIELIFLDRYSRYLLSPYIIIIWSFIAILVGDFVPGSFPNAVLTLVALIIVSVLFIIKLTVMLVKHYVRPLK